MINKAKLFLKILPVTLLFVSVAVACVPVNKASALDGSQFMPGRIIDDVVFTNKDSMSVPQIQAFLDAKIPACDTDGSEPYSGTTRAIYSASSANGNTTPFICLNQYYENPDATYAAVHTYVNASGTTVNDTYNYHQNNYYQITGFNTTYVNGDYTQGVSSVKPVYQNKNGVVPAGAKSAAQLIWDVAQMYTINPQSLIVLLQKEQGIVTDDWAWAMQYEKATGYMCPDTAPCNPTKAGFYNQIENAAWQFRADINNIASLDDWGYYGLGWNNIRYSPNAACGTKAVYIENAATAALYKYTPYTPNDAALANLYGSGDGCSAYGNRNFWRMFNDWFGSTLAPNYSWQIINQYAYTDETKTAGKSTVGLLPGDRVYVGFTARNTGNITWTNSGSNPIDVGTTHSTDRSSKFADNAWLGQNRPAKLKEASVAPGEIGTFEFWMKAPTTPGVHLEYFSLVAEGAAWFNDLNMYFCMQVNTPNYSWQVINQYAYTDETKTAGKSTVGLMPGDRVYVGFTARNTGNITWTNSGSNPVDVGTTHSTDRSSKFADNAWLGQNRPAKLKEASVAPGEIGTFEFWMKAPTTPGVHLEYFSLVAEGAAWFNDLNMYFCMQVNTPNYSWQVINQYAYTDETKTAGKSTVGLMPGDRVYVGFTARNTGNITWTNSGSNPVDVGTTHSTDRSSKFADNTWLGQNRPAKLKEASVAPGEIGTFEFWMKAPTTPGVHLEYFSLVAEGAAWFNDLNMYFCMQVI